jgi:uncharacterized membrane protein
MDRAATWRQRVDLPTNWAITTGGTAVSFVLSDPVHSHVVLLLVMLMTVSFLVIEARRMRFYDLWGSWVRVLETEYYVPLLRDNTISANVYWQRVLVRDLDDPHFKVSLWQLVGRRLRDNYLAMFTFLLLAWLLKLLIHVPAPAAPNVETRFVEQAAIGPIPGALVITAVLGFYTTLIIVTLLSSRRSTPNIEVLTGERALQHMSSPRQQPMAGHQSAATVLAHFDDDHNDFFEPKD